jgi:hypothetical protein
VAANPFATPGKWLCGALHAHTKGGVAWKNPLWS